MENLTSVLTSFLPDDAQTLGRTSGDSKDKAGHRISSLSLHVGLPAPVYRVETEARS